MGQRVWLAMFGCESVRHPRTEEKANVEAERECGVMRVVAQEAAGEHHAEVHGAEDGKFSALWGHGPFLSSVRYLGVSRLLSGRLHRGPGGAGRPGAWASSG